MDKYGLAAVAVICIALIECVALYMGINGTVLATSLAIIAAIIGGTIGFGAGQVNTYIKKKP